MPKFPYPRFSASSPSYPNGSSPDMVNQAKNDILVVQDLKWPPNDPPRYLPKSVTMLLANICETTNDGVDRLWLLLREVVWVFDE